MATIGICGMGRLGLPVGLAIESMGHEVLGYDIMREPYEQIANRRIPQLEAGVPELLQTTHLEMVKDLGELVLRSDILFLPIQTPHVERFEGTTRLPEDRTDFDYTHLKKAVTDITNKSKELDKVTTLSVISTCLPQTFENEIRPLLNENIDYVYNPAYIAMGTVVENFLDPEFVLLGVDKPEVADRLEEFYKTLHDKPVFRTDITTAEGIKVFYNTFITAKTLLANAWMQTAHKTGMNVDDITKALSLATDRLLSPRYMRGGGPDSGGCHPRDLIALAHLGDRIDLKPNFFDLMAVTRELQTEWTVDLIDEYYQQYELPVYVMGKAFKPETNLTVGSGATLVVNILKERGINAIHYDPHIDKEQPIFEKGIYFIATEHEAFKIHPYPEGSVILDLWRTIPKNDKLIVVGIGANILSGE